MSAKHRSALRSARTALLRSIVVDERLLSALVSMSVIEPSLKDEIDVSNTWWASGVIVKTVTHGQTTSTVITAANMLSDKKD